MRGYMIKVQKAKEVIRDVGSAVIAYSGGVDSALLARIAIDELGEGKIVLVTAESETFTPEEHKRAASYANHLGVEHIVVRTGEMDDPRFRANSPGKCYFCKSIRYTALDKMRRERGFVAILDGTNADDSGDFRPGARAAMKFNVRQPLKEAGVTKEEVRAAAKAMGLPMWNHPAQACLASRVQYGIEITRELIGRIEKAERLIGEIIGTKELRVRHHGDLARIEVPASFIEPLVSDEVRNGVVDLLKELGYHYVAIDMQGYRTGSMNEALSGEELSQ